MASGTQTKAQFKSTRDYIPFILEQISADTSAKTVTLTSAAPRDATRNTRNTSYFTL